MRRAEALETADATLVQAGFKTSQRCIVRRSCFDFAARKEGQLLFLKVLSDLRGVSKIDAAGIRMISRCFSGASIIICDRHNDKMLRDDTIYSRHGVYVITSKTLEDIVLRGMRPLVEASPGGYYVRINREKVKERRYELGLSIRELAEMIGVSRRTLYGYERGMTRASVSSAYRLERTLEIPIVEAIDPLKPQPDDRDAGSSPHHNPRIARVKVRNRLLRAVLEKLTKFKFNVSPTIRTSFDFAAYCPHAGMNIIGGVFHKCERSPGRRVEEIISLSEVVEARPLLIGDGGTFSSEDGVTLLRHDELARIRGPEELIMWLQSNLF